MKARAIIFQSILFILVLGGMIFVLRRFFQIDPQPYATGLLIGFVVYLLLRNKKK